MVSSEKPDIMGNGKVDGSKSERQAFDDNKEVKSQVSEDFTSSKCHKQIQLSLGCSSSQSSSTPESSVDNTRERMVFSEISPSDVDSHEVSSESNGIQRSENDTVQRGSGPGLADRLRDIFQGQGDGDLLLQQTEGEDGMLRWLQALDMQVLGACRADERLKPMLKLNISSGVAEDRLLVHLSQHFDASEVGMLARCLCVPLVSIRVGKVVKQGRLFCPIAARGHLNLTFLPSSDLRISFVGDDGCMERLAVLSPDDENAVATIEEIPADTSGRSFEIKLPGNSVFYFWLSEKSKLHGNQLLNKMKDLLKRKPSLAQLTGIRESRLNSFATYLRTSFINSTDTNPTSPANSSLTGPVSIDQCTTQTFSNPTLSSLKPSSRRLTIGQPSKTSPSQGTLSPRTNTFKEATTKNASSLRTGVLVRRGGERNSSHSSLPTLSQLPPPSSTPISSNSTLLSELKTRTETLISQTPLFSLSRSSPSFDPPSFSHSFPSLHPPTSQAPRSPLSPYYCWCPPCPSPLKFTVSSPNLPSVPSKPSALPTLSSYLSVGPSCPPLPPLDLAEPMVGITPPLPGPQQIPTFTPFIADPIVHIPVIDICSSGQAYFVSAGPAISTSISPLQLPNLNLVGGLIPKSESLVEKGARETLRLLIGSTQNETQFIEDSLCTALVGGSRGLFYGSRGMDIATSIGCFSANGSTHLISDSSMSTMHQQPGFSEKLNSIEESSSTIEDSLEVSGSQDEEGSSCSDEGA